MTKMFPETGPAAISGNMFADGFSVRFARINNIACLAAVLFFLFWHDQNNHEFVLP